MTVIRMNTENVRTAASQVDQAAGDLHPKSSKLRSAANSLSGAWEGGSEQAKEIRALANDLKKEVANLQRLAQRVTTETDEWEKADRELSRSMSGIASILPFGMGITSGISRNTIRDLRGAVAKAKAFSKVRLGKSYKGQIIFKGPKSIKDAAGLGKSVTHLKAGNLGRHMAGKKVGFLEWAFAGLDIFDKSKQDLADPQYDTIGKKISAIKFNTSFEVLQTIGAHKVGAIAAGTAVSILVASGALATAPVWLTGAAIAGTAVAVWWAASWAVESITDGAYKYADESGLKNAVVSADAKPIDSAISTGKKIVDAVDGAFKPIFRGFKPSPQSP